MKRVTKYKVCVELVSRLNTLFMSRHSPYLAVIAAYDKNFGETIALFKREENEFKINYVGIASTAKEFIDELETNEIISYEESNNIRGIVPTEFTAGPLTPVQRGRIKAANERYGKK